MAYQTHFLTSKALLQPLNSSIAISSSRGSSFTKQLVHQRSIKPFNNTSNKIKSEHLPTIQRVSSSGAVRNHLTGELASKRTVQFLQENNKPSPIPSRYLIKKSMSTNATKKSVPIASNGFNNTSKESTRRTSSESSKRGRKLWWSPKRNEIEIRSEYENFHKKAQAKVNSLSNIEYRPGGGQVSIRDEPVQWQASPKINSLENANWAPPVPRVNVKSEKLQWNAQSKVDSFGNIDYKPAGGDNIAIRDEKIDLNHVTPRVDCGFVD